MPDGEVSNGGHRSLFQATKKPISSLMTMIAGVEQAAAIRGDKGIAAASPPHPNITRRAPSARTARRCILTTSGTMKPTRQKTACAIL